MRSCDAAVVGHVEWIDFLRVESRARAGRDRRTRRRPGPRPAGGGAVAAVQLANLGCETTFFTALGDDELGHRSRSELEARGVRVHVGRGSREPQRRGVTYVDDARRAHDHRDRREAQAARRRRLASVGGAAPHGLRLLHRRRRPRRSGRRGTRASSSRPRASCRRCALPASSSTRSSGARTDAGERYEPGDLDPPPRLVVATSGRLGGWIAAGRAVRRRAACPARSRMPTAPATASRPG